ncbi:oxidative stress-induced growth inhibitor 2 [Chanos chanos]|uniref:Oxidative stress-induced growth inhibitor 2 n=1 Tax=Chanos chanos TaxID=29144 RepID=A0A6J2W7Z8_CHACN|nr:oxidative stress-induced growth inhibitor 2-like [Chanos chanos]
MPLLEESSLPRERSPTVVPVVIIGNGPSGICLSYMLSGYTPYLDTNTVHPNPILYRKLQEAKHIPVTEQSLEYLCEGLEGRSGNPVAVLFDTLLHPNADLGFEFPPVLQWRLEKERHIPHLVLGKATPGGAWHAMEGSMLTISLGIWMELPGVNYRHMALGKRRTVTNDRATPEEISSYYRNYVKIMGLQKNFLDNTYVTSIRRLHRDHDHNARKGNGVENGIESGQLNGSGKHYNHCENGIGNGQKRKENGFSNGKLENGLQNGTGGDKMEGHEDDGQEGSEGEKGESGISHGSMQGLWEVRGYQCLHGDTHVPFSLFAENVVLATGASDSPDRLGVEGEDLPFVFHSVRDLGVAVSHHGSLGPASDPVLVVGAGLSAADAVLCACNHGVSVLHAFRKRADDPGLIFKQLPKTLYPEYHRVYHMMCSQAYPASPVSQPSTNSTAPCTSTGLYPDYTSFPEHCVLSFQPDMRCVLRGPNGTLRVFKVSMVLVLIGSHPDLFFLKEHGQYLGMDPTRPISCKQNPVDINPYTFECTAEPGLFAMGPLVGDNFVRFLKGGALGITSCLLKRLKQQMKKEKLIPDGEDGRGGRGGRVGGGGFV